MNLNYFFLSKYIFSNLKIYPKIQTLTYNVVIHYKQKNKLFLFINIITLLLFFNNNIKSHYYFKSNTINILKILIRNEKNIYIFLHNFIFNYFPLIDSFSSEFKYILKRNTINICFFKFPLFFELNILFNSLEYLIHFLNSYKFELKFFFKKQKNKLKNYNLLHFLKFPLLKK